MRRLWWMLPVVVLAFVFGCTRSAPPPSGVKAQIPWVTDPKLAFAQAKSTGRPMMMDTMASWCGACKRLDADVWSRPDVAEVAKSFVPVKVDGDKYPDVPKQYGVSGFPTTLFLSPEGKELSRVRGAAPYQDMIVAMKDALDKAAKPK